MKKIITFLLILSSLFISNTLLAQVKTPYEKKVDILTREFLKDVGLKQIFIDDIMKKGSANDALHFTEVRQQLSVFARSDYGKLRVIKFEQDVKNAEKLKNETDFQKDREKKKAKEEKERQEQLAKEEEKRKLEFKKSDYYRIATNIKEEFEAWAKKGEFEKTSDYENRINNESINKFSKICFDEVYKKIGVYESTYQSEHTNSYLDYPIRIKLGEYDADNEQFNATLTGYRDYSDQNIANAIIKIPMDEAKSFKENFNLYTYRLEVQANDWCFDNNNILPKKITIKKVKEGNIGTAYTLITQINESKDIIFHSNNLKIDNLNTSFNYNQEAPLIFNKIEQQKAETERIKKAEQEEQNRLRNEERFHSLVKAAENDQYNDYFKNKSAKDIQSIDHIIYTDYLSRKIGYYQQALNLKENEDVRKQLEKYETNRKEYLELKEKKEKEQEEKWEKKQKRDKRMKTINNILR